MLFLSPVTSSVLLETVGILCSVCTVYMCYEVIMALASRHCQPSSADVQLGGAIVVALRR